MRLARIAAFASFLSSAAAAETLTVLPVLDGDIDFDPISGEPSIDADGERLFLFSNRFNGGNFVVLEYDLSAIPDGSEIDAARIALSDVTGSYGPAVPGSVTLGVGASVGAGDGALAVDDISGETVALSGIPFTGEDADGEGRPDCAPCLLDILTVDPIEDLLGGDLVRFALQFEFPSDFDGVSIQFTATEGAAARAPALTVAFTPIPLPASGLALLAALGAFPAVRRMRR